MATSESGIDSIGNPCSSSTGSCAISNVSVDSQSSGGALPSASPGIHNGSNDETLFTKPPPRDGMTAQVDSIFTKKKKTASYERNSSV